MKKILLLTGLVLGISTAWGQYCLPTYNTACTSGDFINDMTFNTISNLGTGCTSPNVNNYQDYTALSTNVIQNTSYTITVAPGPSWGQYFVAYIDFNNDSDFDDPGEFFDIGYASGGTTISNTILIPNGIPGGSVRMRVLCKYGTGAVLAGQACNNFSYGETEDYTLNISTPLTDDAGISAFVTPSLPTCSFTDSIRVTITNYGTDTLFSANIDWAINAAPMTTVNWTGALPPLTSDTVNLGLFPLANGDALNAMTTMPNGFVENPTGAWNDFSSIASLQTGLNGIYTIGGVAPDYATFAAAISDINTFGLCGGVIFDVRDGIYNEQIDLTAIASDATNNITFRSENGDASLVTVSYSPVGAADNFVVNLNNTDYITFEDLTLENTGASYGRVLTINGGADDNHFEDCHLHAITSTSTSTNYAILYSNNGKDNGNVFMNNTFEGGSYGAYYYGNGTAPADLESGTVFEGNIFLDNYYYGARFERQDAPVFVGNSFIGESTYTGSRFAMYVNYCDNGFTATDNLIVGSATTGWRYGMYILNSDATTGNHASVANNMVQVGQIGNTSTFYGIYTSNCGYIDFQHNSCYTNDGGTSSRAFYGTGGGGNTLANNIFVNNTPGYAIYLASNYTVVSSDNNLYHSPNGNVGYFGSNQATLTDFQTASGYDANSIDINPMFHSDYDLHVCNDTIKGLGIPLAIASDIDGHPRNASTPDMGADEFSAQNTQFLGADVDFCAGDSVLLWAGSPTDAITWSTGDTTTMIWVSAAGTYDVTIVGACGTAYDTVVVSASADVYTNYIVADTMAFCSGESVQLSSSMTADTYLWTGGSTSDSLTVTVGGTYTLNITDACGTGSESIIINEYSTPTASFTSISSFVTTQFTNTTPMSGTMTYAWDFGDSNSSTDSDPIHIYSAAGTYWVELTVTNECGTHVYGDSITTSTVGLEEISNFGTVTVYPNPSNGFYNIDFNLTAAQDVNLVVVNVLGEVVLTKHIGMTSGVHSDVIDITKNAPGVYFVKLLSNNEEVLTKLLIKK